MKRHTTVLIIALAPCAALAQRGPNDAYSRPAGTHEVAIERNVMVPMRDGTRLATDLYRPKDLAGARPTILVRTPYNKAARADGDPNALFFASHG